MIGDAPAATTARRSAAVSRALLRRLDQVAGATQALEWVLQQAVLEAGISNPELLNRLERFLLLLIKAQAFIADLGVEP